ncbi:cupin domain-containing protein [Rubripirellula amarantea]|uniref:Cupin domain protein n=1 Tax=Rubripirellula amarantea TaxID=2527999 RepID=A0A5C5WH18_9BACT|nr:cupin domain-containing protein [Rubripirellula amarantea]MDA8745145.1 cupin domain-containing protein [Rubripirellula amarantea]TWT49293.1 Cupin domain protein [Rubripirellula amarantea]
MNQGNLHADLSIKGTQERVDVLAANGRIRIERIVSLAHQSPEGFWYDQDEDEWVAVLSGAAIIEFDDDGTVVRLQVGDWLQIPAHRRHRVTWTTPDEPTVWLAVFYS